MDPHEAILVGIDGSEAAHAAARYAAAEARRRGARLRLVHVVPGHEAGPVRPSEEESWRWEARRRGKVLLATAEREARDVLGETAVTSETLGGYRVETLLRAAAGTSLVVLGDERRPTWERIATTSVLAEVAAYSPVPVVAVPAGWSSAPDRASVVVGVKNCYESSGLVREAVRAATDRGADLVVVHAWQVPPTYGGIFLSDGDPWERERAARSVLEQVLSTMPRPPDMDVRIDVRRGQAARVLVDASREADLLLITRRPHGFPFGHLGGTGRALLRESQCPVEVLPPSAQVLAQPPEADPT